MAEGTSDIRLIRASSPTLQNWKKPSGSHEKKLESNVSVDCGWGSLIFAHTFRDDQKLVEALKNEKPGKRDLAFYVRDPHVITSLAPQELFLDPSHSYRLWLHKYRPSQETSHRIFIRRIKSKEDIRAINKIYMSRNMLIVPDDFLWKKRNSKNVFALVAEDLNNAEIAGQMLVVDHVETFDDPEKGVSFWGLAVEPQSIVPGVGLAIMRYLIEYCIAHKRAYLDLSVMHDNSSAISLYEKLGFERIPAFAVKRRSPINENLFIPASLEDQLNPYAKIITREARLRGIQVEINDVDNSFFTLSHGGRSIMCRESLTELTKALSFTICNDKTLTRKALKKAGLNVPAQRLAGSDAENQAFLKLYGSLVVKPAIGEQASGVSVDIRNLDDLNASIKRAKNISKKVILEEFVQGEDLRIIVINYKVVAAATRKPAQITGNGILKIRDLIRQQSRRREAATAGESSIPMDYETERCVIQAGHTLDSVLSAKEKLVVRKTANLHSGGTIHDVTDMVHETILNAAVAAAQALKIPVTGLDFIVPEINSPDYVIIEANERPGLENHQPQPTAQRFIDLLFPETASFQG